MPETCHAEGCSEPPAFTVYWPGQTTRQCAVHAAQAQAVARHVGFELTIEIIVPKEVPDGV